MFLTRNSQNHQQISVKIFIICNLLHVVPSIYVVENTKTRKTHAKKPRSTIICNRKNGKAFSLLRGIFLRCRKSLCSKGCTDETKGRGCSFETRTTTIRDARETRAPRRTPRDWLPTDAERRLWIGAVWGSSRWNGGRGEGRIGRLTWRYGVGDARGTPWTLGTDGIIYRVSRFEFRWARRNLKNSFFVIFFFFFYRRWDVPCLVSRARWEFNFDQVKREWKRMFYVLYYEYFFFGEEINIFLLFSWEEIDLREVNLIEIESY